MRSGLISAALVASVGVAEAHPHVFVDGRVDFVFDAQAQLKGIEVTWLYDPFETLYVLSSLKIDPGSAWTLDEEERASVIAYESDWADTFNGAARLSMDETPLELKRPTDFHARLVGNQLEVTFVRDLTAPVASDIGDVTVTFYEETYYYAFAITEVPEFIGNADGCSATVDRFDPDTQMAALQSMLARLSREETPEDIDVGRLFTDRIHLTCG